MGWGKWIAFGILEMALFFVGVRIGIGSGRGEGGVHAASIGWALGVVIAVSAAFAVVGFWAT